MVPHNLGYVVSAVDDLMTAATGHLVVRLGLNLMFNNFTKLDISIFGCRLSLCIRHSEFEVWFSIIN